MMIELLMNIFEYSFQHWLENCIQYLNVYDNCFTEMCLLILIIEMTQKKHDNKLTLLKYSVTGL